MQHYSGNQAYLKDLNMMSTLRQIRSHGLISRAQLADILRLNRSTITSIVNELLERKLVKEVGSGASKSGRPPTLIQFNNEIAYSVCVDMGSRQTKIYITDLGGKLFYEHSIDHCSKNPRAQIFRIIKIIKEKLAELPAKELGLFGIGIAVTGPVIDKKIVSSHNLEWNDVPVYNYFSEEFDCPIIIDNDANAGLIAENYFGIAIGEQNFCYLRIGRGISAGIFVNGEVYRGSEGFAGRIGHMSVDKYGKKCICGNRGCLETYVSEKALIERYLELTGSHASIDQFQTREIFNLINQSDTNAMIALHEMAEYLGMGIANIINFLNPNLIVIGGSIASISSKLFNPLNNIVQQSKLALFKGNIKFSSLGENSIRLGMISLVLDNIFSTPTIKV